MHYIDITEGSKDKYHVQFLSDFLCEQKNASIEKVLWQIISGAEVAKVDGMVLDKILNIVDIHIQGLKQGVALIHGYIHFIDSTIETICLRHRGVDC